MHTSGLAAPVLRAEDGLTAEQLRAAAAAGHANPCLNPEAAYALVQAQAKAVAQTAQERKPV